MKRVIKIRNLDCAACAAELQEELAAIEGLSDVSVDFVGQRISLVHEGEAPLQKAIDTIVHFEEVEIADGSAPPKKERHVKEIVCIAVAAALFLPALIAELTGGVNAWVTFGLYLGSFAAAGWPVVWSIVKNIGRMFKGGFHPGVLLDENLLMAVAAAGAFAIRQDMEGAIVMLLYQIGELLQDLAVGSSRGAIERLMQLKSDTAIRLEDGEPHEVHPDELAAGDVILVRRGDKVPADCRLLEGETAYPLRRIHPVKFCGHRSEVQNLFHRTVVHADDSETCHGLVLQINLAGSVIRRPVRRAEHHIFESDAFGHISYQIPFFNHEIMNLIALAVELAFQHERFHCLSLHVDVPLQKYGILGIVIICRCHEGLELVVSGYDNPLHPLVRSFGSDIHSRIPHQIHQSGCSIVGIHIRPHSCIFDLISLRHLYREYRQPVVPCRERSILPVRKESHR